MPRLTNNTREVVDFIINGAAKDGVPPTDSLAPGETKDIDAVDNATLKGRIASGMITIADGRVPHAQPAANRTQVQPTKE